jgi:SAM-dependent methyltransferase
MIPAPNKEPSEVCGNVDFRERAALGRAEVKDGCETFSATLQRLGQNCWQAIGSFIFVCRGRPPFAKGYRHYKDRYLRRVIESDETLQLFDRNQQLPENFGSRLDERVVEYPWLLSRLSHFAKQSRFLDAGSTLNYESILRHRNVNPHKWSILTLSPEPSCFWNLGVSYLYEDLRALPFQDDWFDGITCVSVIEHVGMDNADYAGVDSYREKRPRDFLRAISEMRRVIRSGGSLLLTVPFGRYHDYGWLQQFDSAMLADLISEFRPRKIDRSFFCYTDRGWKLTQEHECQDLEYVDGLRNRRSSPNGSVDPASNFAVTARGVACIQLQK